MTNDSCLEREILTFVDVTTDQGTELEKGSVGVIADKVSDDSYIIEFAIPDDTLVGGHRFETAVMDTPTFAIAG